MNGVICFFFALAVFVANGKITDIKVYIPDKGGKMVVIGCSAMLRCAVLQDAPSKIDYRWTAYYFASKKTEDLPDKTSSIEIKSVKVEYRIITCYAKDKDGEENIQLMVATNPNKNQKPRIMSTPFSYGLGMKKPLSCVLNQAPICPNSKFKWYKDGSEQEGLNSQTIEVETTGNETKYSCKLEVGGSLGKESGPETIKGKRIDSVSVPYTPELLAGKPATFKAVVSISDKFKNEKVAYVWKGNDITQDPKSPSMATLSPAEDTKGSFDLIVELGPEKETTNLVFQTIDNLDFVEPKVQNKERVRAWTAGGYYTLVCVEEYFNNYPSITYRWKFKGEKEKDANEMSSCKDKNCKMSNVSLSDKGEYTCSFSIFGMKSPLSEAFPISIKTEKGRQCTKLSDCEPKDSTWFLNEMWVTLDCIGGICTCLNETCQDGCAVTAAGCPDLRHKETDDGAGDKTGDGAGDKTGNGTGDVTVLNRTCIDEPETPAFIIPHGVCDKKDTSCKHEVVELSNNHTIMCDTHTDGGGWIVLQRRPTTTRVFVEKGWDEYISGFGNITDSFWMGLEPMHRLCPPKKKPCELRIDLMFEGQEAYATYGEFNVAGGFDNYKLSVKGFKGMKKTDIMTAANGLRFVAKDAPGTNEGVSCLAHGGGWWFSNTCSQMSLNRMPKNGSLLLTEMKIRRGN